VNPTEFQTLSNAIGDEIARMLPTVLQASEDWSIGQGNCVLCAMDDEGNTAMRIYGTDPVRQRQAALVAHKKALQVWRTGHATGSFEALVYTGQLNPDASGIPHPEFIGWQGGVEAETTTGERLVLAFSGLRGEQDVAVLRTAGEQLGAYSLVA